MSVLWLQLPRVLVCSLHVVYADVTQDFLQVNLRRKKQSQKWTQGQTLFMYISDEFHEGIRAALASYHRLFGDVHQVFDVVVLMLLKSREQHVQHLLLVSSGSLALLLLLPLILELWQRVDRQVNT